MAELISARASAIAQAAQNWGQEDDITVLSLTFVPVGVPKGLALLLLSDGVVEARNGKGELLGFERMAPLTIKPTAEIAQAAQRWGQEDDITVLTVTRVPKLEVATA